MLHYTPSLSETSDFITWKAKLKVNASTNEFLYLEISYSLIGGGSSFLANKKVL